MKFTVERDVLKDALAGVVGHAKGGLTLPILTHILVEADQRTIRLTGHDLDSCTQITIPAEVEAPGAMAIPADRLNRLVIGLPKAGQIIVTADENRAKVRAGRSSYEFALLPPSEFPGVLEPKDTVSITLDAKQIARLFKVPAPCISEEKTRYYLNGIYLHRLKDQIVAVATDGHTLLRASVSVPSAPFDGVIIPERSCAEIVRVAGDDTVTLGISKVLLSCETKGRRFVSKLIDGTYPDYAAILPQRTAPTMTLDCVSMDTALVRLIAACDPKREPVVRLSWDSNPDTLRASLRSDDAAGEEQIECDSMDREAGEIGLQVHYMQKLIEAIGGDSVRLYIAGTGEPVRFESLVTDDIIAVCMPCRV